MYVCSHHDFTYRYMEQNSEYPEHRSEMEEQHTNNSTSISNGTKPTTRYMTYCLHCNSLQWQDQYKENGWIAPANSSDDIILPPVATTNWPYPLYDLVFNQSHPDPKIDAALLLHRPPWSHLLPYAESCGTTHTNNIRQKSSTTTVIPVPYRHGYKIVWVLASYE